jgi:hypothetical protein
MQSHSNNCSLSFSCRRRAALPGIPSSLLRLLQPQQSQRKSAATSASPRRLPVNWARRPSDATGATRQPAGTTSSPSASSAPLLGMHHQQQQQAGRRRRTMTNSSRYFQLQCTYVHTCIGKLIYLQRM